MHKLLQKTGIFLLLLAASWTAGCAALPTSSAPADLLHTPGSAPLLPALSTPASPDVVQTSTVDLPAVMNAVTVQSTATETPRPTPTPEPGVRFAVIGDYGLAGQAEADVAALIMSWQPDLILTTGDNNYPDGAANTIDANIGQYFHSYISPYQGRYGAGAEKNLFFPTLGNHDWNTASAAAYLDYFALPGNERYYDFVWEPVHFFAVDSDSREPDGVGRSSAQAAWLQAALAGSTQPWKIVFMHHPAYSSGYHGSVDWMRWPFTEWGATAVLAGHDHTYERLQVDGMTYFVNGLGGGPIYSFGSVLEGSQVRYNDDYGAMLVDATPRSIRFQFITRGGTVIDDYTISAP